MKYFIVFCGYSIVIEMRIWSSEEESINWIELEIFFACDLVDHIFLIRCNVVGLDYLEPGYWDDFAICYCIFHRNAAMKIFE